MALADAGGSRPSRSTTSTPTPPSTPVGDSSEVRALRRALGDEVAARTMVSSTKSMHGHCLGAAGGVEAALTALTIREGMVPPTINLDDLDPRVRGRRPRRQLGPRGRRAGGVSSAFGFGGHNAILCSAAWRTGDGAAAAGCRGWRAALQPREHPALRADAAASRAFSWIDGERVAIGSIPVGDAVRAAARARA